MKMNSFLATPLRIAVSTALTLAACGPVLRAADGNPPDKLTYQGYLVDAAGSALGLTAPKNYDVIFRIYNHETASGTTYRLWSELQTVTVDKGYFSVVLGEGGAYEPREASVVVPGIDLAALAKFAADPDQHAALRAWQAALRGA